MRIVRRQKIEGHVGRHHLHVHGSHGAGLHFQGYKRKKEKKKSKEGAYGVETERGEI